MLKRAKKRIKGIILKGIKLWIKLFFLPVKIIMVQNCRKSMVILQRFLISCCQEAEKQCECFVTFSFRNKDYMKCEGIKEKRLNKKIAVILQGPLIEKDSFTLNTVRRYMDYSNDLVVIVSTWNDESSETIAQINAVGAIVVTSTKPDMPGIAHINYQLVSMQAGIKVAQNLGCEYICKTRTDQRLYNSSSFHYMALLLEEYPSSSSIIKNRIIAFSTEYGSLYKPYYISDFLYFGKKDDMTAFLTIPLDSRNIGFTKCKSREAAEGELIPEIYIIRKYIKAIEGNYDTTIRGYWEFVKDCMILVDKSQFDLYWPKYDERYCEHIRNGSYSVANENIREFNFDFGTWLCLYKGILEYKPEYEKMTELQI